MSSSNGRGGAVYLTGGGPTAVINRTLVAAVRRAHERDGFSFFFGAKNGIDGFLKNEFVDLLRIPQEELRRIERTPGAYLGTTRTNPVDKLSQDPYAKARAFVETCKAHNIRYVLFNGGNDTAEACHQIKRIADEMGYPLIAVHLIKTVDNDLERTDRCPGYLSAARHVAHRARSLYHEVASFRNYVIVMEIMGRKSGFLTAASVLANFRQERGGGPSVVLLPEYPIELGNLCEIVNSRLQSDNGVLIAVSEGIRIADNGSSYVLAEALQKKTETTETDSFGNTVLTNVGVASFIAGLLKAEKITKRARAEVLGYSVRADMLLVAEQDALDAWAVGRAGIDCTLERQSKSVILKPLIGNTPETDLADLVELAGKVRVLDETLADSSGPKQAFFEKFGPLVDVPETALPPDGRYAVNLSPKQTVRKETEKAF